MKLLIVDDHPLFGVGFVHALVEVAVDVLKRSADKNDAKATIAAIAATKLDTIVGHIEWNGKELPPFNHTPEIFSGRWYRPGC